MYQIDTLIEETYNHYKDILGEMQEELGKLPQGCLSRIVSEKGVRFNHLVCSTAKNSQGESIYKQARLGITKNLELQRKLARKKYLEVAIARCRELLKALKPLLGMSLTLDFDEIREELPKAYSELDDNAFFPEIDEALDWGRESYVKSNFMLENLRYTTKKGDKVRSKSELHIANLLFDNNVPYRYEAQINIDGSVFYPDFTIKRPKDGKIVYWEHCGLTNNKDYVKNHNNKMMNYQINGQIVPWDNLIVSYEIDIASPTMINNFIENRLL